MNVGTASESEASSESESSSGDGSSEEAGRRQPVAAPMWAADWVRLLQEALRSLDPEDPAPYLMLRTFAWAP